MLDQERQYYANNLAEWLAKYPGKFAVVKGQELVGLFDTLDEALTEGARRFGLESFLTRRIEAAQEQDIHIPALTLGILRANSSHPV